MACAQATAASEAAGGARVVPAAALAEVVAPTEVASRPVAKAFPSLEAAASVVSMTLAEFKLLFAERPEAPEGVEFWEWREMPVTMRERVLDEELRTRVCGSSVLIGTEHGRQARVCLWRAGGPPVPVYLVWPNRHRLIYYHAEREGALT